MAKTIANEKKVQWVTFFSHTLLFLVIIHIPLCLLAQDGDGHIHFYETVWFYLILLLIMGIVMLVMYRFRVHRVRKQRDELEILVTRRTQEIERKKYEIEQAYDNMKLLSEMGQNIISTLSVETIARRVYKNVQTLMSADCFGVGIYNPSLNRIEFRGVLEGDKVLPFHYEQVEGTDRLSVYCFKNQAEILINEYAKEYSKYISTHYNPAVGEDAVSIIYLPLKAKDKPIGVVTVQSFQKHAYTEYHLNMLRNLAAYIAIALDNAKSLEDLKDTQVQLVQAEKMASLGQLAAGIAHEINNPINYIATSVRPLRQDMDELKRLLNLVDKLTVENSNEVTIPELISLYKDLDVNFLLKEIDSLLEGVEDGSARTQEIVAGMKNFARSDVHSFQLANVHEGINSTLRLLGNLLKDRIQIHKEYGEVAEIECLPGKLNQVFMNILGNAAQAIEGEGEIRIKTWSDKKTMYISIGDNGAGMSEEVKNRIFEPFYTTKKVGEGTGLGLSISFGIVEEHKGKIEVKSKEHKGTEFIISLPIHQ